MKNAMKKVAVFLKKAWYLLLLLAAGGLAIGESIRITDKYQPDNWLAGPSGFIMIVGLLLVVLLLFNVLMNIVHGLLKKKHDNTACSAAEASEAEEPVLQASVELEEAEKEKQRYARNMWISFGLLIVYTLLIKALGFSISSALYLIANLFLLKNSWKTTVITVIVIFLFLLFAAPLLGMSFPRGIFGF